jgi:Ni/Co efflux regulator RcnB
MSLADERRRFMKRLKMFLVAAALMTAGSALATAQPFEHDGRRDRDRDHERVERRYDRDDRGFRDRDDRHYFVGERRYINGYYWTWDGGRWCRRDGGVSLYLAF